MTSVNRSVALWGVGCGVWGVGCGVWGVGCGVWGGVGCGVWGGVGWCGVRGAGCSPEANSARNPFPFSPVLTFSPVLSGQCSVL